jgi:ABC-type polysaccharide transport system permease subunit
VAAEVTDTESSIYTAPVGVTSIVLMAQVSNVDTASPADKWVTAAHYDGANSRYLVKQFVVPSNDAVSVLTGKLVLQTGQSIRMQAESNNFLEVVLSILETSNE